MTMFSMKPKFDLAEFLAVPAPAGAARAGGGRRRGMTFNRASPEAAPAATTDSTGTADTKD